MLLALRGSYAPTILTVRMHRDDSGHEQRARPHYRLLHIQDGVHRLCIGDDTLRASNGDICLIPPDTACTWTSHSTSRSQMIAFSVMACPLEQGETWSALHIAPGAPPQPQPDQIWGCTLPIIQPAEVSDQIRDLISLIVTECWHSVAQRLMCQQRLGFVLERIIWPHLEQSPINTKGPDHPIARVHTVIQTRLPTIKTAADIATHLGISVSLMNKDYRTATEGDTPAAFLRRYRLAEAARLVLEGKAPLNQIAKQVGYRDDKALYKAWMRVYDLPPRQWRQSQRY